MFKKACLCYPLSHWTPGRGLTTVCGLQKCVFLCGMNPIWKNVEWGVTENFIRPSETEKMIAMCSPMIPNFVSDGPG